MRISNPVVNFRPLGERNFAACCIIIFCAYAALYGQSTSLPALLQSFFGYDAYHSGLVLSPSGISAIARLADRAARSWAVGLTRAGSSESDWPRSRLPAIGCR